MNSWPTLACRPLSAIKQQRATRNDKSNRKPKTNQFLRQLPQWHHRPSPCSDRNRTRQRV